MPWTSKDAYRHTKAANTSTLQRQWAHIANSALERTGDEALAIREANGVVGHGGKKQKLKRAKR